MEFEYFFFAPLDYEIFQGYLQEYSGSQSLKNAIPSYLGWTLEFCRKAQYFYQYQYRKHSDLVWEEFCKVFSVPKYEHPDNLGFEVEWKEWKEQYNLNDHYEKRQQAIEDLADLRKITENKLKPLITEEQSEVISSYEISQIWFNSVIHNPLRIAEELKSLPYHEKYLQTTHWKKVRSAMLLINYATCQAKECLTTGESWYGGSESEVDVHHINYSNLGNERFLAHVQDK